MKFDFESLSSEPLVYMLTQSGAFVCVLGFIFFVIGMLFGYATWGRYKLQTRELRGEAEALKEEIAVLKRKIGDHSIKSGAAVAMATETIHMPKKDGAAPVQDASMVAEATVTPPQIVPPAPPAAAPLVQDDLPKVPANIIKVRAASAAAVPLELIAKTDDNEADQAPVKEPDAPPPEPVLEEAPISSAETPPEHERHGSPLAAIIAPQPPKDGPDEIAPADGAPLTSEAESSPEPSEIIPTVVELSVLPLPALDFHPELDPKLGLIYKTRPEQIDDLTELKGISEILQQRLNDLGVYTFAQIAAWDDDLIKEFSARLAFKDRIQREHWVEQAAQLAAKPVAA